MFTTDGKNEMLNGSVVTTLGLHTAYPGTTGANEASGGGYSRQAITFATAAGEVRTGGSVTFNVAAGTYRWVTGWGGSTCKFVVPNGGSPKEFFALASADLIYCASHGYSDGQTIVFYGNTPPAPLVAGTTYYTRDCTTDSFKVAATAGGAAIDITTAGSSGCMVSKITEQTYASADTHTISSSTLGLPF